MNESILKKIPVFPLLALGIAFLLFAGFIDNFFYYDDFRYIENNFHDLAHILLGYNTLRLVSNVIWSPLYYVFGFNPVGYNLFNITLYALNAILFFYFIRNLFKNSTLAFFAGLFFILSGVGADAVLWKCANNSLLCLCFYLLTLITYVRFRECSNRKFLLLSLTCYSFAMFSKEEAASLPAILLMMEFLVLSGTIFNRNVMYRVLPYCVIICVYLLLNKVVFSWLALAPAELARFYQIHPLYSLAGGFSAFFLSPSGVLRSINPLAYFAGIAVAASLFLVKDKKLLLFAFGWIIFTFLPQSLTSLGQFEPRYMANSIGRYLYIVSIGPALVYAVLLTNLKERLSGAAFLMIAVITVAGFGWINYGNVQQRGQQWKNEAAPVAVYLAELGKIMPAFPPDSFVYVNNPPTGRAYIQQSMRAFYRNPAITWIKTPEKYRRKPGERAFLINIDWDGPARINRMQISEPWPMAVGQ
jgi:hypothetical protein